MSAIKAVLLLPSFVAAAYFSHGSVARAVTRKSWRPAARMDASKADAASLTEKIRQLESSVADLEARGVSAEALTPLRKEIDALKITDLESQLSALKASAAPPAARSLPVEDEKFDLFPSPASLGVAGQRCVIIFYANDGIPRAEALLETFEDEAAECTAVIRMGRDPRSPSAAALHLVQWTHR